MLSDFIDEKLHQAVYELLEDGTYFGEIKEIRGVWANNKTLESCRNELREVLESWLIVSLRHGDIIPGLEPAREASGDAAYA